MAEITIQHAFDLAVQQHQAGRLAEAEQCYRQILAQQPEHSQAMHLLGVIAHQTGRNEIALDLIRRAMTLNPRLPGAHNNLGNVLQQTGKVVEAIAAYRQALLLRPDEPVTQVNLGNALRDNRQIDAAIAAYRQAIALRPDYAEAHSNLGRALGDGGHVDEAIAAYRQAIAFNPNLAEAHSNLGNLLREKGQIDQAVDACRRAVAINPNFAIAHNNLGNALRDRGRLDEAIAAFRQAIALQPDFAGAYSNLGNALKQIGRLDEAIATYHEAIRLKPAYAGAHDSLAGALADAGQLDEAIAAARRAVVLDPMNASIHSNLVYALHYHAAYDAKAIAGEHRDWNRQHAEPLASRILPHQNNRSPTRRLRVAYLSPDFGLHPVGHALLPVLEQHDAAEFEIVCLSNVAVPDSVTAEFQARAHVWRSVVGLSDQQTADLIRHEGIDILVDLSLHMARNRVLVFARKPAPVQVTWLGYPSTTGLTTVDYRLSDPFIDPPGDDPPYVETTVRLPHSYLCWRWKSEEEATTPLPMLANGYVTFGSLNGFSKVGPEVLTVWARILSALPNSRLILRCPPGDTSRRVQAVFANHGISADRIELGPRSPRAQYIEQIRRQDISLDPFPYCGHTTSCDALWMGVPVITLAGATGVSRGGVSLLSNLGLTELIAGNADQYVQIAAALANDVGRLTELRSTLRRRMAESALMDAPKFARNLEAAYRQMWRTWCEKS